MTDGVATLWPIKKAGLAFLMALLVAFLPLPSWLDDQPLVDQYFEQSLQQTLAAYAAVRILNASVSMVQESQLQVQPAGVGASLALGQLLDPLNDMTERVSDVLVWSAASLGVQKIFYDISGAVFRPVLAFALFLLGLAYAFAAKQKGLAWSGYTFRLVLLVLVLRLFLPVSAIMSEQLQQHFFTPKINAAYQAIDVSFNPQALGSAPASNPSTWDKLTGKHQGLSEKAAMLRKAFSELVQKADAFIENLVQLITLFVGLWLMQLLLPVVGIFLLWRFSGVFV